jgi:serine/threonine protein kinase
MITSLSSPKMPRNPQGVEKADPESFEYEEELGSGSFGKVYKVRHKSTGEICAMKILQRSKIESANLLKYALTERNVMSYIRHPFIVSLRYAFQTQNQFVLVMKYCPGGNMQTLLKREQKLPVPLAKHYSGEVLLALAHLHEHKVLYRDLKPENIVFDAERHAMVTDFGLSKEGVEGTLAKSFLGSVCFLAPEILERSGHNHTVDVYGLGVLVYNTIVGKPPFYDTNRKQLWENIRTAPLVIPPEVPVDAASFIEQTMKRTPSERLGASSTLEVQKHRFFEDLDFEALLKREIPVPEFQAVAKEKPKLENPAVQAAVPQARHIFGRSLCCTRVFKCLGRPEQEGWDFVGSRVGGHSNAGSQIMSQDQSGAVSESVDPACTNNIIDIAKRAFSKSKPIERAIEKV